MNSRAIKIHYKYNDVIGVAELNLITNEKCILELSIPGKNKMTAEGEDFFESFKILRYIDKSIIYFCKGSKVNVMPSRMTRQMTRGLSAYETMLGVPARKENLVNIFDYEENNLVSDPIQQDEYQKEWFYH